MAEFFKTSTIWVVDFLYDGRARRWFKAIDPASDPSQRMAERLRTWYGDRARLVGVRPATEDEERQYLRGETPAAPYCPTGRGGPPGQTP